MILLFIIISILYLLLMTFMLSLYYTNRKDKEEIENRILQLEKRISDNIRETNRDITSLEELLSYTDEKLEKRFYDIKHLPKFDEYMDFITHKKGYGKEVDEMACKKGRGGRKK